jgi:hypothetical protein
VGPHYSFHTCANIYGCKEGQKFSKYSGYSKLTENNKVYYSEDFVIKSDYFPYRILDFERLDKLNRDLKDTNKQYHYIIVGTGDQKDAKALQYIVIAIFFIFTQWLNWRYRFLISGKLSK